jgi:hypothetical protein
MEEILSEINTQFTCNYFNQTWKYWGRVSLVLLTLFLYLNQLDSIASGL